MKPKEKQKYSNEYTLHQSVKKELQSLGITKLPNPDRLDHTISNLENAYSNTQKEILNLQKQQKTLNIIKQNVEHLLNHDTNNKAQAHHRTEQLH